MNCVNPVSTAEHAAHPASSGANAATDCIDNLPLPYLELDVHGVIIRANRATLALHPADRGELIGQTAWDLVAADEKDPSFASYCLALESGEKPQAVLRSLCDRSGQFRAYEIHRGQVRDAQGKVTGMRLLCVDVSEAKKALEAAQRKSLWLESVIASVCEAIVVTDAVGFIRSVNPAAETLLGWQAEELTGMSIEEGLPIVAFRPGGCSACTFTRWLEGPLKGIAAILNRQRQQIQVGLGIAPIVDNPNGLTTGAVLLLRKIEIRR